MFLLIISILSAIQFSSCNFLAAEANYHKPNLERNNIVNKRVWVRNKFKENLFEKTSAGNFVFRPNSVDADRLLETNFDTFANNVMAETPLVSGYVERLRRSTDQMRKRHSRKSIKSKKLKHNIESTSTTNTKTQVPNLKPTSVFNDYPYEVAILLNNNRKDLVNIINDRNNNTINTTTDNIEGNLTTVDVGESNVTESPTSENNVSPPKRSRKHNFGIDNSGPIDIIEDFNKTTVNEKSKINRNAFDRNDRIWHQNAPIPDTNVYEIVPKEKPKTITERGLIKVISMLTKTFKKIMKQHNEVKRIYDKFNTINDDFIKQVNNMNTKFQDFDSKYSDMIQFNDKVKIIEEKLISEEEYLKKKHKEMDNNIIEFENQQNKFLAQQKQFYTIQKVMLAQNEKIHIKQNTIAKTQSEISHRQNNFARILKKTKQLFMDSNKKLNQTNVKINIAKADVIYDVKPIQTTTVPASTAQSIKLNLFSIPPKNKLSNQDDLIIKEKDERTIDDLVYKYYFNNTFIDNLMKSKILNNYASNTNSIEIARNVKNKRDELETTVLLPVNNKDGKNRVRRWIHSKDKKYNVPKQGVTHAIMNPEFSKGSDKSDPFLTMATSFCVEIGQNTNAQSLKWCVEKALRRLRFMDKKLFSKPVTVMKEKKPQKLQQVLKVQSTTRKPEVTSYPFGLSKVWMTTLAIDPISTPMYAVPGQEIFFPDNEELETNLKQYDLTPDTEGNVYYDGSLHLSDLGHFAQDSDGMSDVMPGLVNNNSQEEMNPIALDLQSKRRAYVKRLNDNIFNRMKFRKL